MRCDVHEWVVYTVVLKQGFLMLQCVNCGLHATVEDPSEEEWSEAYYAPLRPYRWQDEARVVIQQDMPEDMFLVQKKPPSFKKCPCYAKVNEQEPGDHEQKKRTSTSTCACCGGELGGQELCLQEPGDYERVWFEQFAVARWMVTAADRKELLELAALADEDGSLCSAHFPHFIEGYQRHNNGVPGHFVRMFANELKIFGANGCHCSSSSIATILRFLAEPPPGRAGGSNARSGWWRKPRLGKRPGHRGKRRQ
jgi:hypothetical protein